MQSDTRTQSVVKLNGQMNYSGPAVGDRTVGLLREGILSSVYEELLNNSSLYELTEV